MPAGLNESILGFENVEGMIDKCVGKLKSILDRWRCFLDEKDLKDLLDVVEYQGKIKQQIKLVSDLYQEFERIDQKDLTSSPWKLLGRGQYGCVFKAKMKGSIVAVKVLKKQKLVNEGRILRLLRHDNIVAYRGMDFLKTDLPQYDLKKYNLKKDDFMIIMEYVPDNLSMHVENLKSPEVQGLPKSQVWDFGEQIMSGLYYLHSFSIAHRDLKPDNILVKKGVTMRLKLADFGLAFRVQNSIDVGEKGMQHLRWCAPECLDPENYKVELFSDIFSYGLVLSYMLTGNKPYGVEVQSCDAERGDLEEPMLPDPPQNLGTGPLKDIYDSCLCVEPHQRPTAGEIITKKFQAHTTNPYTVTTQTAEFFTCGFLKNTQIVVADSLVNESSIGSYAGSRRPQGYPPDCLSCEVEIGNDDYDYVPNISIYHETYQAKCHKWRNDKTIDDNPNIALKGLTTPREGEDEEQRVELKFAQATYVHHRGMRDVWKGLDENTKSQILPCKTCVHPMFSTSFGLHVAVITADQPQKFLFTRRAKRDGVASPGDFTCGAVESCSVKDYVTRDGQTYVELIKTAARGLEEELGVVLNGQDLDAICLTTVYLKYDNHEWGMCGFVDLSDERIAPEHRLTYDSITSRFTGGSCKDKFEHDRVVGIPFNLNEMALFVRQNSHAFASSAKLVVVKVMQSFFGVSEVEKIFKALDSSN